MFHPYDSIYITSSFDFTHPISDDNFCHVFIVLNNIQFYPVNDK